MLGSRQGYPRTHPSAADLHAVGLRTHTQNLEIKANNNAWGFEMQQQKKFIGLSMSNERHKITC